MFVALVGVSLRSEGGEVDPAVSPAGEEEAVPVVPGELGVAVDFHPGGRPPVDLVEPGGGIKEIGRTVEGALVAGEEPAIVWSGGPEDRGNMALLHPKLTADGLPTRPLCVPVGHKSTSASAAAQPKNRCLN